MLILHSGSDSYRLHRATGDLISLYCTEFGSALNITIIDGSAPDAAERIERPLKYPSFFNEKNLIVVRSAAGPAMADILKRYKPQQLDDIICIAVQDTGEESCEKKILSSLEKAADRSASFEKLSGASLTAWVREYCGQYHVTIEPAALAAIVQRTNGDTQLLSNELDKLCAYVRNGNIGPQDVLTLIPPRYEQDEWELSNALAAHDKRTAIAVLWRRLQQGVPEQLLLASLAAGIRNLSMVKDMQTRHQPQSTVAAATGLHPFVISKTARGAAAADTARLRNAHISLARLDRRAKDGMADAIDGMFSVLLSL